MKVFDGEKVPMIILSALRPSALLFFGFKPPRGLCCHWCDTLCWRGFNARSLLCQESTQEYWGERFHRSGKVNKLEEVNTETGSTTHCSIGQERSHGDHYQTHQIHLHRSSSEMTRALVSSLTPRMVMIAKNTLPSKLVPYSLMTWAMRRRPSWLAQALAVFT